MPCGHRPSGAGSDDDDVRFFAVAADRERERRGRFDRIGRRRLGLVDRPALEDRVEKPVAEVVLGLV
jgi:hypothetical protein